MKTIIYKANRKTHFFKELNQIFKDIGASGFLAFQTAKRDIQATYRQSALGILWALAPIIMNASVWIFLKETQTVTLRETPIPYPLFAVIGTALWSIFTDSVNNPTNSINAAKSIISKINFPKESLIVAGIYKILFNSMIKLLLVIGFLFFYKITPGTSLLYFPLYFGALILLGTSIGILLAPIGLLYTDVGRAIQLVFTFLMYVTPVVFLQPPHGISSIIYQYNPLSPLIISARNTLTGLPIENGNILLYILIFSCVFGCIGLVLFRNSMNILIEKIS